MRFTDWTSSIPDLGSIGYQTRPDGTGGEEYQRAYRVVGVEEGTSPRRFRLVMERISWDEALTDESRVYWSFYCVPRGR